jgi:hypothetical protein
MLGKALYGRDEAYLPVSLYGRDAVYLSLALRNNVRGAPMWACSENKLIHVETFTPMVATSKPDKSVGRLHIQLAAIRRLSSRSRMGKDGNIIVINHMLVVWVASTKGCQNARSNRFVSLS